MELKHYKRLSAKYSVDIVADGVVDSTFTFETNSLKRAEAKFEEYVEKESFPHEMVQLWSRIKSDDDIELVKESEGTLVLQEEEI